MNLCRHIEVLEVVEGLGGVIGDFVESSRSLLPHTHVLVAVEARAAREFVARTLRNFFAVLDRV